MKKIKNLLPVILLVAIIAIMAVGCSSEADVASRNVSMAADNFEVFRHIVFYNGITGEYIQVIEGFCSLGNYDSNRELSVTCKTGPNQFKKHFLGLSDNVSYFVVQEDANYASTHHYRVFFNPGTLLPDVDMVK